MTSVIYGDELQRKGSIMDCVILFRNTQNGKIGFISDDDPDKIAVFANFDEAMAAADKTTACKAFPYQIVKCDEL